MKIRNGFVSNSSSSSFIILGYKISTNLYNEHYDEINNIFECKKIDEYENSENNCVIIGKVLQDDFEDDGLNYNNFNKLIKYDKILSEKIEFLQDKKLKDEIKNSELNLYTYSYNSE